MNDLGIGQALLFSNVSCPPLYLKPKEVNEGRWKWKC